MASCMSDEASLARQAGPSDQPTAGKGRADLLPSVPASRAAQASGEDGEDMDVDLSGPPDKPPPHRPSGSLVEAANVPQPALDRAELDKMIDAVRARGRPELVLLEQLSVELRDRVARRMYFIESKSVTIIALTSVSLSLVLTCVQ